MPPGEPMGGAFLGDVLVGGAMVKRFEFEFKYFINFVPTYF